MRSSPFDPMYPTYPATIEVSGARRVRARQSAERGFRPDVAELAALITLRTRAIFYASPNNPSGVVLDDAELDAIGALAGRHKLWIVADEVYAALYPDACLPTLAAQLPEQFVTVCSLSKTPCHDGLALWLADRTAHSLSRTRNRLRCACSSVCPVSYRRRLSSPLRMRPPPRAASASSAAAVVKLMVRGLEKLPGIRLYPPDVGMFMLLDVRATGLSGRQFMRALYESQKVSVIDGGAFGRVADEINRTTPKTQSALLEAMNERQVTIDARPLELPNPFMVIATQNPAEHHGTYPLPESQLDRFLMRIRIGYPDAASERDILRQTDSSSEKSARPVVSGRELLDFQDAVRRVSVDDALADYILAIVEKTRTHESLSLGVSPRGSQALYRAVQARALLEGRGYAIADDVKRLAVAVFGHRVVVQARSSIAPQRSHMGDRIIQDILNLIEVPL